MKESKRIKDPPVGILVLVLSQFVFLGATHLANYPKWYEMAGIIFCTLIASDMINFGLKLIKGYDYDPNE